MNESILRFRVSVNDPREAFDRYHPGGATVLNRTTWREKPPRSCGITKVHTLPHRADDRSPWIAEIEVSYRPKGCITYVGTTKYDGWTAMMLDRTQDGTLLDGKGQPLPEGQPPVYLPVEVHKDVDFNDVDFGEFIEELEKPGVPRVSDKDALQQLQATGSVKASIASEFTAPRRSRPLTKIILSNMPSGVRFDGFGSKIINISNSTPQLEQVLMDRVTELMADLSRGKSRSSRFQAAKLSTWNFLIRWSSVRPTSMAKTHGSTC